MKRVVRLGIAGVSLAVIAGGAFLATRGGGGPSLASAAQDAGAAPRAVPVKATKVVKKDVPVMVDGLGTVTPIKTVTVRTQVDGRLDKVSFTEGQFVKAGDLLALVDPRPFSIQLENAEASLLRDEANLKNAELNLGRYVNLRRENLIPQQQVDDQRSAVAQLDAATKADRAAIDSARLNLDYAHIKSPIAGVTGVRLVDPGNIVHASDTGGIVIVTQLDPIAILFTLPQDDLPRVQRAASQGKPHVAAFLRDSATRIAEGQLEVIDNQVNVQTATIRLKAVLPNPERHLWPNQFVRASLHVETIPGALVVAAAAVQRGPQGAFIYMVGADETASPRPVEIQSVQGEDAVVKSGLSPGELVVTDGQSQLRPGAKVTVRDGEKP
jgi:multidrug efflux system membrane fusion protein